MEIGFTISDGNAGNVGICNSGTAMVADSTLSCNTADYGGRCIALRIAGRSDALAAPLGMLESGQVNMQTICMARRARERCNVLESSG